MSFKICPSNKRLLGLLKIRAKGIFTTMVSPNLVMKPGTHLRDTGQQYNSANMASLCPGIISVVITTVP